MTKPKWIRFKNLVNGDNSFQPCPNCGKSNLVTRSLGGCLPIVCDPECTNCNFRFKEYRRLGFKGFYVLSKSEYSTMLRESKPRSNYFLRLRSFFRRKLRI